MILLFFFIQKSIDAPSFISYSYDIRTICLYLYTIGCDAMPRPFIDKSSPIPVYHQISEYLCRLIEEKHLENGDLIPTERELCETFSVSRMTVRQAVEVLVSRGLIVRQKGKGTFVSKAKLNQPLTSLTSFTMDVTQRGMVPANQVLFCEVMAAGQAVASQLSIKPEERVVRLGRIRLANGAPHAYECSHLLYEKAARILDIDLTDRSLYETLSKVCGLHLASARETIEVCQTPAKVCHLLGLPEKTLTFHIRRVTRDCAGRAVEYVESYYRTDKFQFEVELRLDDAGAPN